MVLGFMADMQLPTMDSMSAPDARAFSEASSAARPPGPDDTVLITGGARGVGFAAARAFAESFGCRVVVTGRGMRPAASEVSSLDDEEFAAWRRRRLPTFSR